MIASGVIHENDDIALLEGILVRKLTKNQRHIIVSEQLRRYLYPLVPAGWFVSGENGFLFKTSMPEPDLRITRGDPRD